MWKYAVQLAYEGTDYQGWQKQKSQLGIQAVIEAALEKMTGEKASVVGSGRTDSGVHAVGQVAHFVLREKYREPWVIQKGLNGILPPAIRAVTVWPVPLDFHSQRSALKKQYSYYFQQGACPLPSLKRFSWWIQKPLDLDGMRRAMEFLVGEHDFKPFQASGAKPGPTVRKILEGEIQLKKIDFPVVNFPFSQAMELNQTQSDFGLIQVRLIGTGFLKQMVRGIAGTLLEVGEGRRPPSCMNEILISQDRSSVGPTAPARALWLEKVWY